MPSVSPQTVNAFQAAHFAQAQQRQQHIEQLEDQITELATRIAATTFMSCGFSFRR